MKQAVAEIKVAHINLNVKRKNWNKMTTKCWKAYENNGILKSGTGELNKEQEIVEERFEEEACASVEQKHILKER